MKNNIPLFKVFLTPKDELIPQLEKVLYSGFVTEGQHVVDFEQSFANFIGCKNVLSFYCGTAALHTALILAGVKSGDEVISTPMTAEPTNLAIKYCGAKIVWADVDPYNGNMNPESVNEIISDKTKAILPVHYGGVPASITAIRNIAEQYGIPVIEDAAHALGAKYAGKNIGLHSEYVIFSFQAIKQMTTIDGGMLTLKNPEDLAKGRKIRWFGIDRHVSRTEVDVDIVGYKYHMNNVNAIIGSVQLENIQPILNRYIENGKYFDEHLQNIPGIELCHWDKEAEPSYWLYTVLAERRDDLSKYLKECGIRNGQCHKRNDLHSVFSSSKRDLPGLDLFYSKMLHIPCGWWVTNEDREYIINCIKKGW